MDSLSPELIDTGVDWYTGTLSDHKRIPKLVRKCALRIDSESAAGNDRRVWSQYGYEGFSCGGIRFGSRPDGFIVQLSGPTAQQHWREYFNICDNTSRIDLQVTVRYHTDTSQKIAQHYKSARRFHARGLTRRRVTILKSTDQSATIYLGSRQSNYFGRVYQKDRESGLDHYQNCVRYEMETKSDGARVLADTLYRHSSAEDAGVSIVTRFLKGSGINLPSLSHHQTALKCISRMRSDNYRRLEWLTLQVQPSVQHLLASGKIELVIEALGLTEYVRPLSGKSRKLQQVA